jgi:hypothetical protein
VSRRENGSVGATLNEEEEVMKTPIVLINSRQGMYV